MASRKKSPAKERTLGLFNGGLTLAEEAERSAREEAITIKGATDRSHDGARKDAMDLAVRWLGLDMFEDGDDVMLAIGKRGDAVLIATRSSKHGPSHQAHIRLSPKQLEKLRQIVKGL